MSVQKVILQHSLVYWLCRNVPSPRRPCKVKANFDKKRLIPDYTDFVLEIARLERWNISIQVHLLE